VVPLVAAATLAGACTSDHSSSSSTPVAGRDSAPAISLSASNRELAIGDTVTFTVNSRNTLGHDARVQWITTGGSLTTEDNGQVARARFDAPGAYTVTSILMIDGREAARDDVTVTVKPIR
jgi:plastocyanin